MIKVRTEPFRREKRLKEHHLARGNDIFQSKKDTEEKAKSAQQVSDHPGQRPERSVCLVEFQSGPRHGINPTSHRDRFRGLQTVRLGKTEHLKHHGQFCRHLLVFHAKTGIEAPHLFTVEHRVEYIQRDDRHKEQRDQRTFLQGNNHGNYRADQIGNHHLYDVSVIHIDVIDIPQEFGLYLSAFHLPVVSNGQPLQLPDDAALNPRSRIPDHFIGDCGIPHIGGNILRNHHGKNYRINDNAQQIAFRAPGDQIDHIARHQRHNPDGRSLDYVYQGRIQQFPAVPPEYPLQKTVSFPGTAFFREQGFVIGNPIDLFQSFPFLFFRFALTSWLFRRRLLVFFCPFFQFPFLSYIF